MLVHRYRFNLIAGNISNRTSYHCDTEIQNYICKLAQQISRCISFVKKVIQFCEDTFLYVTSPDWSKVNIKLLHFLQGDSSPSLDFGLICPIQFDDVCYTQ